MAKRVLFLCTHNACRSQMAEGLLRHLAPDFYEVHSAGTLPAERVHPLAVQVMSEIGIDIVGQRPRHVREFWKQPWHQIITVCDRALENCPAFPGNPIKAHWSLPDPALTGGGNEAQLAVFRHVRDELRTLLALWQEADWSRPRRELAVQSRIVVAEGDAMLGEALTYCLQQAGFDARPVNDGRRALKLARADKPDLLILDYDLPKLPGNAVCAAWRQGEAGAVRTPILMISASPRQSDKIAAFEHGVDDYMVKPFGMREFIARVQVLLRRAPARASAENDVEAAFNAPAYAVTLNAETRLVSVRTPTGSREIALSGKELLLLKRLLDEQGRVVPREELAGELWGDSVPVQVEARGDNLETLIRRLRSKLESNPQRPEHILTVRGHGYRFKS